MFNYTNTVILNSLVDEKTGAAKVSYEDKVKGQASYGKVLRVRRVNDYIADGIKGKKVYKRAATPGVKEVAELDITSLSLEANTKYRLVINVLKKNSANSEYSSAGNRYRTKPYLLEFTTKNAVTSAANRTVIINKIKDLILSNQIRFNNAKFELGKYTPASGSGDTAVAESFDTAILGTDISGTKLAFKGIDTRDKFITLDIEKYVGNVAFGEFVSVLNSDLVVPVIAGEEGFGTYDIMSRNVQLQTAERTGFLAQGKDEQIIPGAQYDQYTFEYRIESEVTGMGTVGGIQTTSTSHVFWVKDDLSTAFETELISAALTLVVV